MPVPQRTAFTNLSQLINANQQNRLGSTIQGGVQKDVSGLKQDINQAAGQFGSDVNKAANQNQANQAFVSGAINNIVNPVPPANINAPQGQTAPQPGNVTTNQPTPTVAGTGPTQPGMVQAMQAPSVSQVQSQNAQATQSATPSTKPAPSTTQATNLNALPGSFGYASNATSGANQTTMTNAPTAGDIAKFSQLIQGGYAGPNQLANLATLQAKGANIQDIGQNALRQGGLQNLLQQYVTQGNQYTKGQQALDTAILGQTGKSQLQNVLNTSRGAATLPQQAEANAENLAAQTATANQKFGRDIASQLAGAESPILQNIQQQIKNQEAANTSTQDIASQIYGYLNNPLAQPSTTSPLNKIIGAPKSAIGPSQPTTDQQAAWKAINAASTNGLLSDQDLATIAQNIPLIQQQGLDLKQILRGSFNPYQAPTDPYTMQQGATGEQAAKLNALSQLAGLGSQFGTYGNLNPGTAGFDMQKFMNQIQGATAAPAQGGVGPGYNDSLTPITKPIYNAITNPMDTISTYLNPARIWGGGGNGSILPPISIGGWSPW